MATAEAAADHDVLGIFPLVQHEEPRRHRSKLVGELFDGGMYQAGGEGVVTLKIFINLRLGEAVVWRSLKRIVAFGGNFLPPLVENVPERAPAGAIAQKTVLVLQFLVVSIDDHMRKRVPTVLNNGR